MKMLLRAFSAIALFTGVCFLAGAADRTMTGDISDSMCGTSHAKMISSHQGTKWTDRDCTQACIKAGAKYVFVSEGKVYGISNQGESGLARYAGENVSLTGNVNGDTVTVSKITARK